MRRFIASILTVLIAILSCIPCREMDALTAGEGAPVTIQAAPPAHACDDDHCVDVCSPFCTCACCAGLAMPVYCSMEIKPRPFPSERPIAAYPYKAIPEVFLPVWQPPQLA